MIRRYSISVFLFLTLLSARVSAQHWTRVFTLPNLGSAAFFYNPNIGCIGTGSYPGGFIAQIYYTTDGGNSWTRSLMPNMNLLGQITDIYFTDRWNGWATVHERLEQGWSGVYKTSDGGKSWDLSYQAEFPVTVRQTIRGIFLTDRYRGIRRSTDGGLTFPVVIETGAALGLDFLDDNIGFSSSEGNGLAPPYVTFDGGDNWTPYSTIHEAWTTFADVATKQFFYSSEHDVLFPATVSEIDGSTNFGKDFTTRFSGPHDALTGGIAGTRWCRSVIYAQGQDTSPKNPGALNGMIRSTDGGNSWLKIGGPSNLNDKRFAVAGKGAVVYAFDKIGGVWKTSDGGDGTLSASSLGQISITRVSTSPLRATLCDSADYLVQLTYSDCDSLLITNVGFIDDTIGELRAPKKARFFGKGNTKFDTLLIRFNPLKVHSLTERVRITISQPDGFTEDTIITIKLQGLAAAEEPFIAEAVPNNTLDFGVRSVCGDDSVRTVTITNKGCSPIQIQSLITSGAPFNLLSSFQPFTLDVGATRTVLLQFKPSSIGALTGKLTLATVDSNIVLTLLGVGKTGSRGYKLSQPQIISTICDSTDGDILFKNISCTAIRLDSIGVDAPFRFDAKSLPLNIPTDSSIILHYHFVPNTDGQYSQTVTIHSVNDNDTNNHFDTTLTLSALATRGLPELLLSTASLYFGSINTCAYKDLEVTITNTGCDTLKIGDNIFAGSTVGYTIIQSGKGVNVLRGASTKLIIRFKPPALGIYTSLIHITTNANDRDIILSAKGSNDPGSLSLTTTSIGAVLTCEDSLFAFTLSNTTCDSLTLDSVIFIGTGSSDYLINPFTTTPLPSGTILLLSGKFSPQANGLRSATAHFYLHLIDGTVKEISIPMDGFGIQPVVIQLSLPNVNLTGVTGAIIRLPIQLLDPSIVAVVRINVSLDLNTNVLTPQSIDMTGSAISGAIISPLAVTGSSIAFSLQLPTPQTLAIGLLGTLVLQAYLSDTLMTPIVLTDFTAFRSDSSRECLPTGIIIPPQIVTTFSLTTECGDSTLLSYIKNGIPGLRIERIAPNPTSSKILVTIQIPPIYNNDGFIEIFDALGNRIQSELLVVGNGERKVDRTLDLEGASGLRIVRVRTPQGICSESVYLLK